MSLVGSTVKEQFYNFFMSRVNNLFGVSGLAGNIQAESNFNPCNLQNTYETKLGMTDTEYTQAVDKKTYTNFVYDKAGYGLAQWTFWSRKQALLEYAQKKGVSIGDTEMQFERLYDELNSYGLIDTLKKATSVSEASNVILHKFEAPADQSETVEKYRTSLGEAFYNEFINKEEVTEPEGGNEMSNSSLVNVTVKSPNHSGKRTHSIDRITPHCVVGQLTASAIGGCFTSSSVQASCNYGIGSDGKVVLCVDEANRSWCSSSNANDQRAVTIECASDLTAPYAFKDIVYNKLVDLCVDICKRNGKTKLLWFGNKDKTLNYSPKSNEMVLTVHRWFANKSCPGDWMYARMGNLADAVTKRLDGSATTTTPSTPSTPSTGLNKIPSSVPFTVSVIIDDLNYRSEPNGTVKGQTGKGVFTIVEVKNGWGKLKSGAGWIYLENPAYVTIKGQTTTTAPASKFPYQVKVDITDLRIRKGPGTNYASNGYTGKGVFTITEESDGKGATKWGKLKSGAGWISLDYCTKL